MRASRPCVIAWAALMSGGTSTVARSAATVEEQPPYHATVAGAPLDIRGWPVPVRRSASYNAPVIAPVVLWEDAEVLAVDKPSGWLTIPDRFDRAKAHLHGWAEEMTGARLWKVHRLDRETSGVVLFAKSAEAHRTLNRQFEQRLVQKRYLALVEGGPKPHGFIRFALEEDPERPGRMRVQHFGTSAETHFRVLERFRGFSYLELEPLTGRTHQLRVHCAAMGHALAVDAFYGRRAQLTRGDLGASGAESSTVVIDRLTLHHERIAWQDAQGQGRTVSAPLPEDLQRTLEALRQHARPTPSGGGHTS